MPAPVPPPNEWVIWKPAHRGSANVTCDGCDGHVEARTLQAIGALSLLADDIKNRVDELSALRVVTLRPVVSRTALTEDEVVGTEEVAEGTRADGVHGAGLQIDEDRTRNVLVRADLIVVHVDPLKLEVVVALVQTIRLNAVLVRDDLPELGTFDACQRLELVIAGNRKDIPIWLPHCTTNESHQYACLKSKLKKLQLTWPVWMWTISRMLEGKDTCQHRVVI